MVLKTIYRILSHMLLSIDPHNNLLGEKLAICTGTAKADWVFHFLHLCGCCSAVCL